MNDLGERLARSPPEFSGRIAERYRCPHQLVWRNAQDPFGVLAAALHEPADRTSDAMRRGCEHDPLGEPALIERVAFRPLTREHENHPQRRASQVTKGAMEAGEPLEQFAVAHDHDLGGLPVARTARPASDLEDVLHHVVGNRVWPKLPYGPQAAQEVGELSRFGVLWHALYPFALIRLRLELSPGEMSSLDCLGDPPRIDANFPEVAAERVRIPDEVQLRCVGVCLIAVNDRPSLRPHDSEFADQRFQPPPKSS